MKPSQPGLLCDVCLGLNGPTTDIKVWLLQNAPSDYEELTELRKALYSRHTQGRYTIKRRGQTQFGEEKFTVTGHEGALLIVSDRARHFLLRSLCRLLKRLD